MPLFTVLVVGELIPNVAAIELEEELHIIGIIFGPFDVADGDIMMSLERTERAEEFERALWGIEAERLHEPLFELADEIADLMLFTVRAHIGDRTLIGADGGAAPVLNDPGVVDRTLKEHTLHRDAIGLGRAHQEIITRLAANKTPCVDAMPTLEHRERLMSLPIDGAAHIAAAKVPLAFHPVLRRADSGRSDGEIGIFTHEALLARTKPREIEIVDVLDSLLFLELSDEALPLRVPIGVTTRALV